MNIHTVSIICPVFNEEKYIEACIVSILEQDYPKEAMEVLFIDGNSTDNSTGIIKRYTAQYSFLKLLNNPERIVPYALNKGLKAAKGEVIMRLDAHCTYPTNYISELVRYLYQLNADNVGGVWNTQPAKDTPICQAIAFASSHPFGVGGSMHKIGASKIMETDTVPFGCYKREIFDKTGLFDTDLVRNQDDEFNGRLLNLGGKIYLIPQVIINYTARDTLCKMRKMYYQYGLYKPLVNKKLGAPATVRQFFPILFLLGLTIGGVVCMIWPLLLHFYTSVLLLYLFIGIVVGSMGAIRAHQPLLALLMPYVFFNIHMSYGIGYLVGIFNVLGKKTAQVKPSR
ncbi:Glycosyltransferase, catalytic subunit of cellulose synthase and poly-beta-1,6-N-acetylglucosamine synthase [Xylanibacter ruminicola]|uniref:Glycosyltransferase, catalytic subunit of cellulose synthase and poly-beta-1,6-N-acetylglucosamine synthase n=1 Tax=Xylanibacter ruminicola TaxID=839 RepID=A0A1H4F4I4_XYLRU|nr:glycosyltransferase family 2 protein [Xylanibacter ruminicola]SEA91837.1 Glycosyltransferase, catalytic subunit of cellulose synthase and poly-beta-1,6-N-acetylglucosamine synthase [Xylanibacter ruminicola]